MLNVKKKNVQGDKVNIKTRFHILLEWDVIDKQVEEARMMHAVRDWSWRHPYELI